MSAVPTSLLPALMGHFGRVVGMPRAEFFRRAAMIGAATPQATSRNYRAEIDARKAKLAQSQSRPKRDALAERVEAARKIVERNRSRGF